MNTNSYILRILIQIIKVNMMVRSDTLSNFAISIQILIIFAKLIQIFQSDDILIKKEGKCQLNTSSLLTC